MIAFTPSRGRKRVETEKEVCSAFEDSDTAFMLEDDDGSALLAAGDGFGPYVLEWFPARKVGTHLKAAEELKKSEALDVLLRYHRGGPEWRDGLAWVEVEDERPGWLVRMLAGAWRRLARSPAAAP